MLLSLIAPSDQELRSRAMKTTIFVTALIVSTLPAFGATHEQSSKALLGCFAEVLKGNSEDAMVRNRTLFDCMKRQHFQFCLKCLINNGAGTCGEILDGQYWPICWKLTNQKT